MNVATSKLQVEVFFDAISKTFSYLISCPSTKDCAVIDSVLNFNPNSGKITTDSLNQLAESIRKQNLKLQYILETHIHADHLSGAYQLQQEFGGKLAISEQVTLVQQQLAEEFNLAYPFESQPFDLLLTDKQQLPLGKSQIEVWLTPGHTPACASYLIEGAVFVGDTLFMPDYGTARCDFPGADAQQLYASIQCLLSLPPTTKMYMCHDYLPAGRTEYQYITSVADQQQNVFLQAAEDNPEKFAQLRAARDAQLKLPQQIYPALQVNILGGRLPKPESNGKSYFKLPFFND